MSISTAQVTVGTTATALNSASSSWTRMRVVHAAGSGTTDLYLGGSDVSSSNGMLFAAGTFIDVEIAPGDILYGRKGTGTQAVSVLRVS